MWLGSLEDQWVERGPPVPPCKQEAHAVTCTPERLWFRVNDATDERSENDFSETRTLPLKVLGRWAGAGGRLTVSGAGEAVGFEVARAFLPPMLLSVGVRGGGRVELGAGGAGNAGA